MIPPDAAGAQPKSTGLPGGKAVSRTPERASRLGSRKTADQNIRAATSRL